jgi:threonine dehydratase
MDSILLLNIEQAAEKLKKIILRTPLSLNSKYSRQYEARIYFKREDLQLVRSYKLRGAYNMISSLSPAELSNGVVCASAGNHAQGFAYACKQLEINGIVFMPKSTPNQKISQTKMFGDEFVQLKLTGDTFDDCQQEAIAFAEAHQMQFIPPFDHEKIIEGQGTIGLEIWEDLPSADYIVLPVGGGGLCAGVGAYLKAKNPGIKIIGVEPEGAPSMTAALSANEPVLLQHINKFVDGAAVQKVGNTTFKLCSRYLDKMLVVPEGKICSVILQLYNQEGIIVEPAGTLAIAALDQLADEMQHKNVVCIISGSNNDSDRMQQIKEFSLLYEGIKHYFLLQFPPKTDGIRHFINDIMSKEDELLRIEYVKRNDNDFAQVLVVVQCKSKQGYKNLLNRMQEEKIRFIKIHENDTLYKYLV